MPNDLLDIHWELAYEDAEHERDIYREIVITSWEALASAKAREASLQDQLSACREELRQVRQRLQERE